MRILLVSNLYPPYVVGGYERLAAWVAQGLRERGHSVHVLTGRGPALQGERDLDPTLDLDLPALQAAHFGPGIALGARLGAGLRHHVFSAHNLRAAREVLQRTTPDLVSFWNPAFISFSPLLAARTLGVPTVVHLSDTSANPFRGPHPPAFPRLLRPAARLAVDALLRFSGTRRLVVPSSFLRDKLVRREGLDARRITVLRWPLPPGAERARAPERRESGASRLLFVGSLAAEKGTRVLLQAFRTAWERRPDLSLTLIGDAGEVDVRRLREAATGLPVSFRGQLDHEEVVRQYAAHDVLVFPSVWDEPFALVPLEAAAAGLAVIATTSGGTAEAISDGQTGRLVAPGHPEALAQAILELAADPSLARALGASAQAHVRRSHAFAPFLERLEALYDECRSARPS